MTVPFDKPMLPSTKIVKYSDVIYKNREQVVNAAPERTQGTFCLGLNDCGERDEVTGVPVGTIALHKPVAISDEMENKASKVHT